MYTFVHSRSRVLVRLLNSENKSEIELLETSLKTIGVFQMLKRCVKMSDKRGVRYY